MTAHLRIHLTPAQRRSFAKGGIQLSHAQLANRMSSDGDHVIKVSGGALNHVHSCYKRGMGCRLKADDIEGGLLMSDVKNWYRHAKEQVADIRKRPGQYAEAFKEEIPKAMLLRKLNAGIEAAVEQFGGSPAAQRKLKQVLESTTNVAYDHNWTGDIGDIVRPIVKEAYPHVVSAVKNRVTKKSKVSNDDYIPPEHAQIEKAASNKHKESARQAGLRAAAAAEARRVINDAAARPRFNHVGDGEDDGDFDGGKMSKGLRKFGRTLKSVGKVVGKAAWENRKTIAKTILPEVVKALPPQYQAQGAIASNLVQNNIGGKGIRKLVKGSPEAKAWAAKMQAARAAKRTTGGSFRAK